MFARVGDLDRLGARGARHEREGGDPDRRAERDQPEHASAAPDAGRERGIVGERCRPARRGRDRGDHEQHGAEERQPRRDEEGGREALVHAVTSTSSARCGEVVVRVELVLVDVAARVGEDLVEPAARILGLDALC